MLDQTFRELVDQWRQETSYGSVLAKRFRHPAYQQILAMGPDAVPLILARLQDDPDWWFHALSTLTGVNPLRDGGNSGNFNTAREDWLTWGREQGLVE